MVQLHHSPLPAVHHSPRTTGNNNNKFIPYLLKLALFLGLFIFPVLAERNILKRAKNKRMSQQKSSKQNYQIPSDNRSTRQHGAGRDEIAFLEDQKKKSVVNLLKKKKKQESQQEQTSSENNKIQPKTGGEIAFLENKKKKNSKQTINLLQKMKQQKKTGTKQELVETDGGKQEQEKTHEGKQGKKQEQEENLGGKEGKTGQEQGEKKQEQREAGHAGKQEENEGGKQEETEEKITKNAESKETKSKEQIKSGDQGVWDDALTVRQRVCLVEPEDQKKPVYLTREGYKACIQLPHLKDEYLPEFSKTDINKYLVEYSREINEEAEEANDWQFCTCCCVVVEKSNTERLNPLKGIGSTECEEDYDERWKHACEQLVDEGEKACEKCNVSEGEVEGEEICEKDESFGRR